MRPYAIACLLAAAACTPEPPPPRDAGPSLEAEGLRAMAAPSPGGEAPDAGGPPLALPSTLPLLSAEAVLPDGAASPLARDGVTTVEPSARFRVEIGGRLPDARLSLLDAQDAMVPADGTVEIAATTRFTLTPTAPLRPGSSYALRLEGAEGRLLHAADGGSYEPASLALQTSGTPPPPARARKAKRRRAR